MGDLRPHRKLQVWKLAMDLVQEIYVVTEYFPKLETFGLSSQMRRSAVSIPSNIAEEAGRSGSKEFQRFLNIAQGSASELDTQVELACRLNYLDSVQYKHLTGILTNVSKMMYGLTRSLK